MEKDTYLVNFYSKDGDFLGNDFKVIPLPPIVVGKVIIVFLDYGKIKAGDYEIVWIPPAGSKDFITAVKV